METAHGQPSNGVGALSRVRAAAVVLIGLVVVLLVLSALGAQVGTATLLTVVCVALVAYVVLRRRDRSST